MSVDWNHLWSAPHKTALELAKENRVLAFESLGFSSRALVPSDLGRLWHRAKRFFSRGESFQENLSVYSLPGIPFLGLPGVQFVNFHWQLAALKGILRDRQIKKPLLWTCLPTENFLRLAENLDHSGIVYDCLDDFSSFRGAPANLFAIEKELCEKSAVVFTVSAKQRKLKLDFNPATYYLPNAADPEHFDKAADEKTPIPEDLTQIPGPRIGFLGSFDSWVDMPLIDQMAEARSDWSFVMVGPTDGLKTSDIPKRKNIFFLGEKPYAALPEYMKGLDIAVLPFRSGDHMDSSDPIVMYDFLAAGKPVIATHFPAALAMGSDLVDVNDSLEGMIASIEKELDLLQDSMQAKALAWKRRQAVKGRTWQTRVHDQLAAISKHSTETT